jgi:hypothetical protein
MPEQRMRMDVRMLREAQGRSSDARGFASAIPSMKKPGASRASSVCTRICERCRRQDAGAAVPRVAQLYFAAASETVWAAGALDAGVTCCGPDASVPTGADPAGVKRKNALAWLVSGRM